MSAITGTIKSIHMLGGPPTSVGEGRYEYRLAIECGAMTAGDTAQVLTANTKIANILNNGKTVTLRQCAGSVAGLTPGGTAAYALIATVNGTSLQYSVGNSASAAAVAAGTVVNLYVALDMN